MKRLADSIFQGRSSDVLVVEDAYKIASSENRNTLYDSVKGIYSDSVKSLSTNSSSITDLVRLIADAKSGYVDKPEMMTRALGLMGSSLPSLLGQLGGSLKNTLTETFGEFVGDGADMAVSIFHDGAEILTHVTDVTGAGDLVNMVKEMTGSLELGNLINIEAESAILSGMMSSLMDNGIPELIDDVIDIASCDGVRDNAMIWVSGAAILDSNMGLITKVIDTVGVPKFLSENPNGVNDILQSYDIGADTLLATYSTKRTELLGVLDSIDVNWDKVSRNGELVPNLGAYAGMSDSAKKLLTMGEPHLTNALVAEHFEASTPKMVINTLYPNAYIA